MKSFIHNDFMLYTKAAKELYHTYSENQKIIDYHCHLPVKDIAEDRQFKSITELWLEGDHYKWRAMRTNGVSENIITGKNTPDFEKFLKWAETVPYTVRNPLYHWTHLELKRYFGIDELLSPDSAKKIYEKANGLISTKEYSVKNLIRKMNVEIVCTTDDPIDSLEYHQKIKNDGFEIKVLPAWRPDKARAVENPVQYKKYLEKLAEVSGVNINSYEKLIEALRIRHNFFHNNGCRLSDHALETFFFIKYTPSQISEAFDKVLAGKQISQEEIEQLKMAILFEFCIMDYEKGWVQQFHVGALRNNNDRIMRLLGADSGVDSIGDWPVAEPMAKFINKLDTDNKLTKTILYNLNPAHNEVYATMLGNFQDGSVPGKIQWGAAWWFLDQKEGIEKHLDALSSLGLLSRFVGMLTDSRSFLSYPRHEYFRRILCNKLGEDIEKGELPNDINWIGKIVSDISYFNAKNYFGF
jgi:glucuronate isomerase